MIQPPLTWIEISKPALLHNMRAYKKAIGKKSLGAVIKSNAYGHGLLEVATICQESPDVDWLFTGTLSEALQVRAAGISKPILILYFIDADPGLLATHHIDTIVSDIQTLTMLHEVGVAQGKKIGVHLKFDSGMSRFGFNPEEALVLTQKALSLSGISVQGICSHLAQAANADQTFNKEQEQIFNGILNLLAQYKIEIPLVHFTNSAGTTALDNEKTNLVRVGLGLYGWWPSVFTKEYTQHRFPGFTLRPALTFKTKVFQIKGLPAGKFVGYDRTYKTTKPTRVAVLPVGYYDGYDRRLSSKGILFIKGQYAPVIGIIAMTTTIVDITHIPDVQVGDEVILMGDYDNVTPIHIAELTGSFNAREMITRLNPAIPRIVVS